MHEQNMNVQKLVGFVQYAIHARSFQLPTSTGNEAGGVLTLNRAYTLSGNSCYGLNLSKIHL